MFKQGEQKEAAGKAKAGQGGGAGRDQAITQAYAYRREPARPELPADVLWHPTVELKNGRAQVSFDLPASVTTYRVLLHAHSPSGRLGSAEGKLEVRPAAP
jgi:uncharacterized protein YfaS (alpha-2-macroglobulin family)